MNKILGGKNNEKIESFRQTREEEWRGDSKGNGDIMPGKVDYIIGRMETLLTNCFRIFENNPSDRRLMMLRGGGCIKRKRRAPLDKDILIAAKEQLIDTLTNGQFEIEISSPPRRVINVNDINTKKKYHSIMQSRNLTNAEKSKIKSLKGELERLCSALEPFYDEDYMGYDEDSWEISNSEKSKLSLDQIFANRLKNLDITSFHHRQIDFYASCEDEKWHLSAAVEYIKTKIPTNACIRVILEIEQLKQYRTSYRPNRVEVIAHLKSLKDMKIDSGIIITKNIIYTICEVVPQYTHSVFVQLNKFFPTLLPHYYRNFLYLIEELSSDNPNFNLTFRNGETLIQQIPHYLIKRVEFARIISSSGLMEPMFSKLADEEYVNILRQWPRARVNLFLNALRNTGVQINGGKKTRRRRTSRSTNKTHRKNIQVPLQSSSASYKSTYETNGRNKTKRSNRPKKNKTRRKRNY